MSLPNHQQPQTGDPLPPLLSICLLKSSPLLSQPSSPRLPDYLDCLLLLPTLQYPPDKTPAPSTSSSPLDDSPHDLSIAPSLHTTWTHPPIIPSSMGWSSPQKHTHASSTSNSPPRKKAIRRRWMTLMKPLSSLKPVSSGTSTPSATLQTATSRTADSLTSPSLSETDSPAQPNGSSNLMMAKSLAIQRKMVLTTSPTSARFMQHPSTQLTLQSLSPIGSTKPFKGWPVPMLSSLMWLRAWTIGASKLTLCGIEILTNMSSTTKLSLTTSTVSSKAPSLPAISVRAGWNVHNFQSGFHIWQENPCTCPPTNVLTKGGRKDKDITSKGEHDVIDLTVKDSSSDDKEL